MIHKRRIAKDRRAVTNSMITHWRADLSGEAMFEDLAHDYEDYLREVEDDGESVDDGVERVFSPNLTEEWGALSLISLVVRNESLKAVSDRRRVIETPTIHKTDLFPR
jgi:hypothetical protein